MGLSLVGQVLEIKRVTEGDRKVLEVRASSDGREIQGDMFGPPGTDCPPMVGDLVISCPTDETGGQEPVGALDAVNAGKAQEGEYRIYSRDASGAPIAEVWLKGDGSIRIAPGSKVEVGDGTRKAVARDGDAVGSGMTEDPVFWTWLAAAAAVLAGLGVVAPTPTSLAGTLTASSTKLEAQ